MRSRTSLQDLLTRVVPAGLPLLLLLPLVACDPVGSAPPDDREPFTPPEYEQGPPISSRADLRMKRWRQIRSDLQGAMELPADQVCREAGLYDCADLHAVSLGGISMDNGLYRASDALSVTSGLAAERWVLQACWTRLQIDLEEGVEPVVFGSVADDPSGTGLETSDAEALTIDLYRRLHARDPLTEELEAVVGLRAGIADGGGGDADWALMACFAVGTTTEALLY